MCLLLRGNLVNGGALSEAVNFLDASVHSHFVEEGALARIVEVICLVEFVDAAHVRLERVG